jgi:small subunit ribosomal protein S18
VASRPFSSAATVVLQPPRNLRSCGGSNRVVVNDSLHRFFFSTTTGGGGSSGSNNDGENDNEKQTKSSNDDSATSNDDTDILILGQEELEVPIPPSYIRDAVTGKWTSNTHAELSKKDKRILNLNDDARSELVMDRLSQRWTTAAAIAAATTTTTKKEEENDNDNFWNGTTTTDDGFGTLNTEHVRIAQRIQEQKLALMSIGRNPASMMNNNSATTHDNKGKKKNSSNNSHNEENYDDEKELTSREYQALKTYAKQEYNIDNKDFVRIMNDGGGGDTTATTDDEPLIPHQVLSSGRDHNSGEGGGTFDADLDLAYLNPRLHRRAFGRTDTSSGDDPFADLLPHDLNPTRKVNRRLAHTLPKRLLHHNNLSLLRRYATPGGKIMNRVQSRLGAKDQRKIAKLVKRARHMGLIPHIGQWKYEDHGNVQELKVNFGIPWAQQHTSTNDDDDDNNAIMKKDWEIELEERGLWPLQPGDEVIKRYYDMDKIIEHIAGPKGSKKRIEFDNLLGGPGALVQ